MSQVHAGIYARVSSEQQAEEGTIESQVASLRERTSADGVELLPELEFLDQGYSGATLVRPALEKLRDVVAAGGVDQVYIHSPDRLARKYAYQFLLVEEFRRAGVEVIFLNRQLGKSPEDDLLLQVQGMVAEYERAKILERSRRGKRHAAQRGAVSVLSTAPYGYRYIGKHHGAGEARFEIVLDEARVVRKIFEWIGRERMSIGQVCRRLKRDGERTRSGKNWWDRTTVWGMLKNPAYKGSAAFGKTKIGPMRQRLRAQRGASEQPRRAYSTYDVPKKEWIAVPVPPIIDEDVFEVVQEQLLENRRRARQRRRGARYLLQGLVMCKRCGHSYYGKAVSNKAAKGKHRDYAYYRCIGTDAYRFGGERICSNRQVRTDMLDQAVWKEVQELLENPARLAEEYQRRLKAPKNRRGRNEPKQLQAQIGKVQRGIARLIDSYADGYIEKVEFEPRIKHHKERLVNLEEQAKQLTDDASVEADIRLIIGRMEEFAGKVKNGLAEADWAARRDIIRTLVKRVEIDERKVNVVFRIDPGPSSGGSDGLNLPDCRRREDRALRRSFLSRMYQSVFHDAAFQHPDD